MKLEDCKEKIDEYFDNITPEELYEKCVMYGFIPCEGVDEEEHLNKLSEFTSEALRKSSHTLMLMYNEQLQKERLKHKKKDDKNLDI